MTWLPDEAFAAQLLIGSTWTKVKAKVSDGVTIAGGRQRDADQSDPLTCRLTLRDPGTGQLNSRNLRSPYYGQLGRATQMRAIAPDTPHLYIPALGAIASTPDTAVLDITGDIDIRADVQPLVWDVTGPIGLADKYQISGDQRSWLLSITTDRRLQFTWSSLGTLASKIDVQSTAAVTVPGDGRLTVRATLDVNNGAGGWTVTFYTGTAGVAGAFTQLGDPVTGAGVTAIFASSAVVRCAPSDSLINPDPYVGRYHALQVRSGIGGSIVANPDFDAQAVVGTAPWSDSAGRTWSLSGGAEFRDYDVRATVELARFPIKASTPNGGVLTAPVTGAGVRRRLDRPKTPLRSPLYREATKAGNLAKLVGYWPAEDGSEATSIASGIGGPSMRISGPITMSTGTDFPGTEPLPQLQTGTNLFAPIPAYTSTGVIAFRALVSVPNPGWPNNATICAVTQGTGTVRRWVLRTNISGDLKLQAVNVEGDVLQETGLIAFNIIGRRQMIGWQVTQTGSDVHWQIFTRAINADLTLVEGGFDGTFTGLPVRAATGVYVASDNNLTDGVVGHIMVGADATLADGLDAAIVGNNGEAAGIRIKRLCGELGVPFRGIGNLNDSEAMGPQKAGKPLELLQQCEASDGGALYEPRDALVLAYRTRRSMYNGTPVAVLTNGLAGESPTLDPDEPADSDVVNDYTASRDGGTSFQAVRETGPNSILDYPDGIGRYDAGDSYSLAADAQVEPLAWWKLHLGSWDEAAYKRVDVNLTKLALLGKNTLAAAVARAGVADRIEIDSPPPWLDPAPIQLLAQGWTETIKPGHRTIALNTTPGRPWDVGVVGVDLVESDGTVLDAGVGASDTLLKLQVTGTPWASTTASVPFIAYLADQAGAFSGERLTVAAISAIGSIALTPGYFEDPDELAAWAATGATLTRSNTQARGGAWSGLLTVTGSPAQAYVRPTGLYASPITPGQLLRAVASVRSTSALSSVGPAIDLLDAGKNYLSTLAPAGVALAANTWADYTFDTTVPATVGGIVPAYAVYGPTIGGSPANGTVIYVDNVDLRDRSVTDRQRMWVTRGLDGVAIPHTAGAELRLYRPLRWAR